MTDLSLSEFICHTELDTVWGPDAVAGVGGPGLPVTQLHTLGGNHSFLRKPSPFAAGGEVAESSFFSLLCSTLAFSSLPTGVSFVAI